MGRFMLPELLGISPGLVVLLVVLMALFMFWGAEQLERIFGGEEAQKKAPWGRYIGAAVLFLGAIAVLLIGQPTNADRWASLAPEKEPLLEERAYQIHPGELLATINDRTLNLVMLDVRDEADYNLFHIEDAHHIPAAELLDHIAEYQAEPANTVFVVMGNDEALATESWKALVAASVPNVYILEGGINYWLRTFAAEDSRIQPFAEAKNDALGYQFTAALGSRLPAATPDPHHFELEYTPKIKLDIKRGPAGGGCG
jgi:rhodanese-related sulfurtransferase